MRTLLRYLGGPDLIVETPVLTATNHRDMVLLASKGQQGSGEQVSYL